MTYVKYFLAAYTAILVAGYTGITYVTRSERNPR